MKKEKELDRLIQIQRSRLVYVMRQKNWDMVVELRREDDFGGQEILRELVSFPVDAEGSYYEKGLAWASGKGIGIENIDQFGPIQMMFEKGLL